MLKKYTPPAGNTKRELPSYPHRFQDPTTTSIIAKVITIQNEVQRQAAKGKEPSSFRQSCRNVEDFMESVMPKRPAQQPRTHSQILLDDVSIPLIAVPSIMRYTNPYDRPGVQSTKVKSKIKPKAKVKVAPGQCQLPLPMLNTSISKVVPAVEKDLNRCKQRRQCRFQQRNNMKYGTAQQLVPCQESIYGDMPRRLPPRQFNDEDSSPYEPYNNSVPRVRLIDNQANDDDEYSSGEDAEVERILENLKQNFDGESENINLPYKVVRTVKSVVPQRASPEPAMSVLYMCPTSTLDRSSKSNICLPCNKFDAVKANCDEKKLPLRPKKKLDLASSKTEVSLSVSKPDAPEPKSDEKVLPPCPKYIVTVDNFKKTKSPPISKLEVAEPNSDEKALCPMKMTDLAGSKTNIRRPICEVDASETKYIERVLPLSPTKMPNEDSAKMSVCPSIADDKTVVSLCSKNTFDEDKFNKAMCVPINGTESEDDEKPCSSHTLYPTPFKSAIHSSKKLDIGIWKVNATAKQRDLDWGQSSCETFAPEVNRQDTEVLVYEIPRNYEKAFAAEVVFGNSVVVPRPPRKSISHYSRPKEVACLYVAFAEGFRLNPDFWTAETMDEIFEHATKLLQRSVQMCFKSSDTAYDIIPQIPDLKTSVNVKLQSGGALEEESKICNLLTRFFSMHTAAIICSDNLFLLAWKRGQNSFFVFDPNGRNELCQRDLTNGKCTLMATGLVEHLVHLIFNLSQVEAGSDFNLYEISLSGFGKLVRTKTPQMCSSSSSSSSTTTSESETSSPSSSET